MRETIGERIRNRRVAMGLSVDEVAKRLGKNRATVYRYESNEIENLPLSILEPLAKVLGVDQAYLMGWEKELSDLNFKRVPLLGEIAAGEPILSTEEYGNFVTINGEMQVDFCLKVKGDSMIDARIHDGDLVFVRKQPCVENGEIAAVLIDSEVTLKRFYKNQNGVILKPENCKYEPVYYTEQDFKDIRILGKAVYSQSKLERK